MYISPLARHLHTYTCVARCCALNHTMQEILQQMPALRGAARGEYSTRKCRGEKKPKQRGTLLQTPMTAAAFSQPRNKKPVRCICLSLCCRSHTAHPSRAWMEETGRVGAAEQNSIAVRPAPIVKSSSSSLSSLRAGEPQKSSSAMGSGAAASHLPSMGRHIFQLCTRGKGIRGLIPA